MKTYCKGLVVDEGLVSRAYSAWLAAPAGHKNSWRAPQEHGSASALVSEVANEIRGRSLRLRPIKRYRHREPTNGKVRTIGVESVKQQLCDYVAVTALEPLLKARVGFWQVSSVKGKGQLMAARAIRRWAHQGGYFVHLDVRKCYPSIKPDVVTRILRRYVRSADVLYLCEALLDTYDGGLEIGSFFSLRMAQLVLSFGYHEVEAMHKERRGRKVALVEHQLWYADDVFLLSHDKRNLRSAARRLERYLKRLGLGLKPWKICKVSEDEPIDAVGYTVRPGRTTIRAALFIRACRAFRAFRRHPTQRKARRVTSYWGYLKHTDSRAVVMRNGFDSTMHIARRMISAAGREQHGNQDDFGHAAAGCAG